MVGTESLGSMLPEMFWKVPQGLEFFGRQLPWRVSHFARRTDWVRFPGRKIILRLVFTGHSHNLVRKWSETVSYQHETKQDRAMSFVLSRDFNFRTDTIPEILSILVD